MAHILAVTQLCIKWAQGNGWWHAHKSGKKGKKNSLTHTCTQILALNLKMFIFKKKKSAPRKNLLSTCKESQFPFLFFLGFCFFSRLPSVTRQITSFSFILVEIHVPFQCLATIRRVNNIPKLKQTQTVNAFNMWKKLFTCPEMTGNPIKVKPF